MKKTTLFLIAFMNATILVLAQKSTLWVNNELILQLKSGIAPATNFIPQRSIQFGIPLLDELNTKYACKNIGLLYTGKDLTPDMLSTFVLTFNDNQDIPKLVQEYDATGLLEYAQPNHIGKHDGVLDVNMTPNEPAAKFKLQWGLYNDGSFTYANGTPPKVGADINIKPAWDITTGDSGTIVAVIDGGINLTHSEFSGRIWKNSDEIPGNNIDDDNNGYVDDVNGWDFSGNNNNVADAGGHGTNVASIIGATGNNGVGWVGINWKCKLMILKNGNGSFSETVIINAIKYAADNGAKVINMSLGFSNVPSSTAMQNAVNYAYNKNVLVIASMGNNNTATPQIPASCTNVMSVGATNVNDTRCVPFGAGGSGAAGSNYGSYISVVAPGNWIVGCLSSGTENYSVYNSYINRLVN